MENHGRLEIGLPATAATAVTVAAAWFLHPPCPIRLLTGWRCPGCGATHALAALLSAHWSVAWSDNPLAVALVVPAATILFLQLYRGSVQIPKLTVFLALAAAAIFGILRNVI